MSIPLIFAGILSQAGVFFIERGAKMAIPEIATALGEPKLSESIEMFSAKELLRDVLELVGSKQLQSKKT